MMDSLKEYRIVTDYDDNGPTSQQVLRIVKGAGLKIRSFSTRAVCVTCRGSGYVDDGPISGDSDCLRRSRKCDACNGDGRPPLPSSEPPAS